MRPAPERSLDLRVFGFEPERPRRIVVGDHDIDLLQTAKEHLVSGVGMPFFRLVVHRSQSVPVASESSRKTVGTGAREVDARTRPSPGNSPPERAQRSHWGGWLGAGSLHGRASVL